MICLMLVTNMKACYAGVFKGDDSLTCFDEEPKIGNHRLMPYNLTYSIGKINGENVFEFCHMLTDGNVVTHNCVYRAAKILCKNFSNDRSLPIQELICSHQMAMTNLIGPFCKKNNIHHMAKLTYLKYKKQ